MKKLTAPVDPSLALVPATEPPPAHGVARRPTPFSDALTPRNHAEAMAWCQRLAKEKWVPQCYRDNPVFVGIAVSFGEKLGLDPLACIQNIAIINGKPCMHGDMMLGIARSVPEFQDYKEEYFTDRVGCRVTVTRRGQTPIVEEFDEHDARTARLWEKAGPWTNYPKRMCMWRARGFALRTAFPDYLAGIISREEAEDWPTRDGRTGEPDVERVTGPKQDAPEALQAQPAQLPAPQVEEVDFSEVLMRIMNAESLADLEGPVGAYIKACGITKKDTRVVTAFKARKQALRAHAAERQGAEGLLERIREHGEDGPPQDGYDRDGYDPSTGEAEPGWDG